MKLSPQEQSEILRLWAPDAHSSCWMIGGFGGHCDSAGFLLFYGEGGLPSPLFDKFLAWCLQYIFNTDMCPRYNEEWHLPMGEYMSVFSYLRVSLI